MPKGQTQRKSSHRGRPASTDTAEQVARRRTEHLEAVLAAEGLDEYTGGAFRGYLAARVREKVWAEVGAELDPAAGSVLEDLLDDPTDPLSPTERVREQQFAELEARTNRARILRDCISVVEAALLTRRARQSLERQARQGRILRLQQGARWWYPKWQFALDGPGGRVAGLGSVLASLHLSPAGAALWLSTGKDELGGKAPIELLQRGEQERVIDLATAHGTMI